jgi:hypothetical protein
MDDIEEPDISRPAYFLAWGESVYQASASRTAAEPQPFLRLTAQSLSDAVAHVDAVGTPGWEYEAAREQLARDPLTPGQLGHFFGASCYLLPANAAARREQSALAERRNARVVRNAENLKRSARRVKLRTDDDTGEAKGS